MVWVSMIMAQAAGKAVAERGNPLEAAAFFCGNIPGENGSLLPDLLYVAKDLVKYIP